MPPLKLLSSGPLARPPEPFVVPYGRPWHTCLPGDPPTHRAAPPIVHLTYSAMAYVYHLPKFPEPFGKRIARSSAQRQPK